MRRQIYIYLHLQHQHQPPEQVSWIVQEPDNTWGPVFHGDLQTAANHAMGCRVIVLVPAEMITLTEVELPAMNRQRLLKAIPFALEEQVAGDVESLHFGAGRRDERGRLACAVVETEVVQGWLEAFKDVSMQADVITSEISALPFEQHCWTLMFNDIGRPDTSVLLKTSDQLGVALDTINATPLIKTFIDNTAEDDLPDQLRVLTCEDVTQSGDDGEGRAREQTAAATVANIIDQLRGVCEEKSIAIERQDSEEHFLTTLAHAFEEKACVNLLQGQFSRKERLEKLIRPWRAAAAIGFVWLVLQLGLMIAEYRELAATDARLRSEIVAVYKEAFPESRNIVDPREQMRRGLEELREGGKGGNDLFMLLAKTGDVIRSTGEMTIRGVRYKTNTLDLDIEISDLQALDQLKLRLANEAKLQVEIVQASAKGGKVESRLQIKQSESG